MVKENTQRPVALLLGGSTGLGAATSKKLAAEGYDVVIVHRDRRSDLDEIHAFFEEIREIGAQCLTFNSDAVLPSKQKTLWEEIKSALQGRKIRVVIHSIAKGNLKPLVGNEETLSNQDMQLTIQAMAISLLDWVKQIATDQYFENDTRIIAYTSEGNTKAIPNYAAVSASKAALEAIVRNIALEYASMGIKANCIQAGITATKSLKLIPNYQSLLDNAKIRNPNKRLTTPEDVANAAFLLTLPEAIWITGTVLKADGGESLQ